MIHTPNHPSIHFPGIRTFTNCLKFYMINSPGKNAPTSDSSNSHESHQITFLPRLNTSLPAWMFTAVLVILVAKTSSLGSKLAMSWNKNKEISRGTVLLHWIERPIWLPIRFFRDWWYNFCRVSWWTLVNFMIWSFIKHCATSQSLYK